MMSTNFTNCTNCAEVIEFVYFVDETGKAFYED